MSQSSHRFDVPSARPEAALASATRWLRFLPLEGSRFVWLLFAAEGLAVAMAVVLSGVPVARAAEQPLLLAFGPVLLVTLATRDAYGRVNRPISDQLVSLVLATAMAAVLVLAAGAVFDRQDQLFGLIAESFLVSSLLLCAVRLTLLLAQRLARHKVGGRRTVIVGAGAVGRQLGRRLVENPGIGLSPVGFVDADPPPDSTVNVLGEPADLGEILARTKADHVIFAFLHAPDAVLLPLVSQCEEAGVEISLVPRLFETTNRRVELAHIGAVPLFALRRTDPKGWQFQVKHAFDRVAAFLGLLALAPLLLIIGFAVRVTSPGPALFRQQRIGRDGARFEMLKFRSMHCLSRAVTTSDRWLDMETAPGGVEGEDRRTRVGRFLRRTSLDELPQLINVLKGAMSLVGPRPERPEFVEEFGQNIHRYTDRHRVRSGITGSAQVAGLRGQTPIIDRIEWDNHYIENWSLALDLKLLALTLWAVIQPAE